MRRKGDDEEESPTELRRLFIREVSLVGAPANRKRFLLFKSDSHEGGGDTVPPTLTDEEVEAIDAALNTEFEGEADVLKALEEVKKRALSKHAQNAVIGMLRLAKAYEGEIGPDLIKQLRTLLAPTETQKTKEPPPKTDAAPSGAIPDEVLAIAKAASSAEEYASIVKAAQESPATVGLLLQVLQKRDDARDKELAELKKFQVGVIAKDHHDRAAKLVHEKSLPGMDFEKQIEFVKSFSPEQLETFSGWADGLRESVNQALTTEIGTSRRAFAQTGSALDEIQKRASELVEKSEGKLSIGDAQLKVMEDDPALAARYRRELLGIGG